MRHTLSYTDFMYDGHQYHTSGMAEGMLLAHHKDGIPTTASEYGNAYDNRRLIDDIAGTLTDALNAVLGHAGNPFDRMQYALERAKEAEKAAKRLTQLITELAQSAPPAPQE